MQTEPAIQSGSADAALVSLRVNGRVQDATGARIELRDTPVDIGLMNLDRRAWKRLTTMGRDGSFSFAVRVTPGRYFVVAVARGVLLAEKVVEALAVETVAKVVTVVLMVMPDGALRCGLENIAREQQLLPPSTTTNPPSVTTQAKPALVNAREYFYATDRARTPATAGFGPPYYTEDLAAAGTLAFGTFFIPAPPGAPRPQPKEQPPDLFFGKLKDEIARSPERKLLIFVHGYWSPFADAMETAARLDAALTFKGPVLLFSWPSQGGVSWRKYDAAQRRAGDASLDLRDLLDAIRERTSPAKVDIIAHSLGGQVLSGVIEAVTPARVFNQIVLVAPDLSADTLKRQGSDLKSTAARTTLYGSSHDCALRVSSLLHSNITTAGQVQSGMLVVPPAESVDVSGAVAGDDMLGHSYYLSRRVADDLLKTLAGETPLQRALPPSTTSPVYWILR